MDEVLLAALLIGWAAVLLPSALKSRRSSDPIVTVGGFSEAMAVLRGRPQGREIMVPGQADRIVGRGPAAGGGATSGATTGTRARPSPRASSRARLLERRRATFVRLLVATGVTFVLAVPVGGLLWPLFVTMALVLFGYVAMLRHFKVERDEARSVVRSMQASSPPTHAPSPQAAPSRPAWEPEQAREPVAVGAGLHGGVQVATRPDVPWEPRASVRIRRWDT